jgi:hypothetical protein
MMARMTGGESEFENLRENLSEAYSGISDSELELTMARRGVNAEAMEGFFDDLGKFAAKAAPVVLPIAGQVVGSIYGGPAGGAIGKQLGSFAGGAISNVAGGAKPAAPAGAPSSAAGSSAPSPAAGQLLNTITRPETLQALASMAMGVMGKSNVNVGGTSVPVSAFSNLLSTLAERAEAEYNAALAQDQGSVPKYLKDPSGKVKGDPAVAADRAEALYELLGSTEAVGESVEAGESAESSEALSEWESEADAAEALEMAEGYESEEI